MKKFMGHFMVIFVMLAESVIITSCNQPHPLITSVVPPSSGSVSPSSGNFTSDVVLVASPAKYYKFAGWAGDASGTTNPLTVNMNSSRNVIASFTRIQYNLQTQSLPSNGGIINLNSGNYDAGTQVAVTVTPNTGYRFDHWSGDVTGNSNKSMLLMDDNRTVTAYFIKVYNLTVNLPSGVGVTVIPNSGIYDANTKVTLTANATMCPYAFDHWNGTDNDNVNPTTLTMNADKSVTMYCELPCAREHRASGSL